MEFLVLNFLFLLIMFFPFLTAFWHIKVPKSPKKWSQKLFFLEISRFSGFSISVLVVCQNTHKRNFSKDFHHLQGKINVYFTYKNIFFTSKCSSLRLKIEIPMYIRKFRYVHPKGCPFMTSQYRDQYNWSKMIFF